MTGEEGEGEEEGTEEMAKPYTCHPPSFLCSTFALCHRHAIVTIFMRWTYSYNISAIGIWHVTT